MKPSNARPLRGGFKIKEEPNQPRVRTRRKGRATDKAQSGGVNIALQRSRNRNSTTTQTEAARGLGERTKGTNARNVTTINGISGGPAIRCQKVIWRLFFKTCSTDRNQNAPFAKSQMERAGENSASTTATRPGKFAGCCATDATEVLAFLPTTLKQ